MSNLLKSNQKKMKRQKEKKEMKDTFGKKARIKCIHCGKYTLFKVVFVKGLNGKVRKEYVCVRCGK